MQCLLLGFGRRSSHENEGKISDVVLTLACRIVEVEVEAVTLSTSGYASEGDFIFAALSRSLVPMAHSISHRQLLFGDKLFPFSSGKSTFPIAGIQ